MYNTTRKQQQLRQRFLRQRQQQLRLAKTLNAYYAAYGDNFEAHYHWHTALCQTAN